MQECIVELWVCCFDDVQPSESRPSVINIMKKRIAHSGDTGIFVTAAGYTTKANVTPATPKPQHTCRLHSEVQQTSEQTTRTRFSHFVDFKTQLARQEAQEGEDDETSEE